MTADDAGFLVDSYLRRAERGACLHARHDIPGDLVWVEWPSWDGGAVHALARRTRGRWRTTLLRTARDQGPGDVLARLKAGKAGAVGAEYLERPDDERARTVFGALCGDLSGLLAIALHGSPVAADDRTVREAEAIHARDVAPMVELLHGRDLLDAAGECAAGRIGVDAVGLLTDAGPLGERLRGLRRTHPLVARLALSSTLCVRSLCAGEGLHAALAIPCPGYTPGHLRRAAGATLGPIAAVAPVGEGLVPSDEDALRLARMTVRLAASLPADWMPVTPGAWSALAILATVLAAAPALDRSALARSKGDWEGLVARLARAEGIAAAHPRAVAAGLVESVDRIKGLQQAFLHQVVLPLCANATHRLAYAPGDGFDEMDLPTDRAMVAVEGVLWSDKDIGACLELSRRWASRRDAIERSVACVEGDGVDQSLWAALSVPFAHGGAEVRPVLDALSLWEEGASTADRDGLPGLAHCIYGRLRLFRGGSAHVLSIRSTEDGSRLSTAQVLVDVAGPRLVEHRGHANADPPPAARIALGAYLNALGTGDLGPLPERPAQREADDRLWDLCGYDWRLSESVGTALSAWGPLLPRWLRGLGAEDAFEALAARGLLPRPA